MPQSSKNKQLAIAYLNTLTFSCVQILLFITIPYIVDKTEITMSNLIAAISVGSLIFAFMGPFWATKSDGLGRKNIISLGMFGMGLSFLILSLIFIFNDQLSLSLKTIMIYASRITYGLLVSAIVPVSQAWQLDLIDTKDKMKVLSRNSMCLSVGRILGPLLILFKQVNFEQMIYGGTIWIFILSISCFFIKTTETKSIKQNKLNNTQPDVGFKWKSLLQESVLPIALALIFTSFIGILQSTLGHHLKVVLNIRGDEATVIMAQLVLAISFIGLFVLQLGQMIFKRDWKSRLIIGSTTLVIGSFLLDAGDSLKMIWIAVGIVSFGMALIPPVYLSLISHTKAEVNVNGKKIGFASISHSLGYALGSGLVALSMKLNIVSNMTVISFVSIVTLFIVLALIHKQKEFVMPEKKSSGQTAPAQS